MPRITARQQILGYIRRWGPTSAVGIGQALNMSAATVRHHLGVLLSDGRIMTNGTRGPGHVRGRPRKLYRISDRMQGDNLGALAGILFSKWVGSSPGLMDSRAKLRLLADELRERMGPMDDRLPPTKRLEQLIDKLNEAHYEARWEAGAEGPRILFGRCPYAEIIDQHPELCVMDGFLLGGAMNAEAEQKAKIDRKTGQPDRCVFALRRAVKRGG